MATAYVADKAHKSLPSAVLSSLPGPAFPWLPTKKTLPYPGREAEPVNPPHSCAVGRSGDHWSKAPRLSQLVQEWAPARRWAFLALSFSEVPQTKGERNNFLSFGIAKLSSRIVI